MRAFLLYDQTTGAILQTCQASGVEDARLHEWAQPGQGLVFLDDHTLDMHRFHVVNGALTPRSTMAPTVSASSFVADGVATCVIADLPDPCVLAIGGALTVPRTAVSGGSVTITATVPGDIILRVTAEPAYLPWESTIHAV